MKIVLFTAAVVVVAVLSVSFPMRSAAPQIPCEPECVDGIVEEATIVEARITEAEAEGIGSLASVCEEEVVQVVEVVEVPKSEKWREDVPMSAELQDALLAICEENGVDPLLALGLIETESNFQTDIVSQWGDHGLCQLNELYFPTNISPEENMRLGIGLLANNIERYGSVAAGLTAYNRGHDDGSRAYASVVLANAAKWGYEQK